MSNTYKLTDEQMRDLVKECGLDWHRGFVPLFDDDPTNRYAVLIEAVSEPLLSCIAELERKSDQDDETIQFQAAEISKHLDRIAELETELVGVRQAADALLVACAENLESKPPPQKYGVPYKEVNALREVIDEAKGDHRGN